ncbi:Hypothetical predicted protein, partial [Mytilus galloprovincialis]
NGCVVVTGSSGTGKSSLVRHVALRMQDEGYDILPVTNPKEIIKWYDPTCPSKKILFVVDDFCGTYTINHMKFENWKNLMEKIKTLIEKKPVKLIMSCRLQVYKDEKMKSLSFYQSCECNLLSKDICLSIKEKYSIAEFYLKTNAYKINTSYYTFDCFPLLCRLCSKNINLSIADFFKSPYTVYKEEIDKLKTEGAHVKYCALALCVIFNNRLKEKWLTKDVDKEIKTIIKNTYEACKVVKGTSRLVIRDELDSLTYTFIRRDGDSYRTIHDKLFDFLAFYFGSVMIQCLIKNASSHFIRERFLFEKNRNSDEYVIIIPKRDLQMYIDRIIDDWSRGNIQDVYCNINMDNPIFRHRFLVCLKGLEISQQKQLASLYDRNNYGTPLIHCCFKGDIDMVTWCLHHCTSNVNQCRESDGASPMIIACQDGHTEIVQMLIKNKANIDKCDDKVVSPLHIACWKGHSVIVQMLIDNEADINNYRSTEKSPLFIACQEGHTEIVQLLINYKADIDKSSFNGLFPLYVACENRHAEVVQMLIDNKADIRKCNDKEASPLYIACEKKHTNIVQILIRNKADINKSTYTGASPLYIACQKGHTEIVQMLINNNADIDNCTYTGSSPLFIACEKRHTEIVQILIKNKADVNRSTYTGASPLYIACQKGHTKIVQMLINSKADLNKCIYNGISPLFIAYQNSHNANGYTKIVQMLINLKADINKCTNTKESPLFIACQEGHTEIVQILIYNKTDINKCRDTGESPLFIACQEGHTEVVRLLISNKADINKCRDTGESSLFIAYQEGHTEIVKMLINNKANILKSSRETPKCIHIIATNNKEHLPRLLTYSIYNNLNAFLTAHNSFLVNSHYYKTCHGFFGLGFIRQRVYQRLITKPRTQDGATLLSQICSRLDIHVGLHFLWRCEYINTCCSDYTVLCLSMLYCYTIVSNKGEVVIRTLLFDDNSKIPFFFGLNKSLDVIFFSAFSFGYVALFRDVKLD